MINQIGYPAINGWVVTENGVLIRCSHCVPTSGGHWSNCPVIPYHNSPIHITYKEAVDIADKAFNLQFLENEEERSKGRVFPQWTFQCGCNVWYEPFDPRKGEAIKDTRSQGWRKSRKHGWLCSTCSKLKEFK